MKTKSNINLILTGLTLFIFIADLHAQFNFYDVTNQPVLTYGAPNDWDDAVVWNPAVIKDGDTLRMWYTGYNEAVNSPWTIPQIGYAWSLNGINWNKYSGNPVVQADYLWESLKLYSCAVIKEADTFKMWYGAAYWSSPTSYVVSPAKKIGYAWSFNGIDWIKHPEPVMEVGAPSEWNDDFIVPYTVIKEADEYKMWYWAGRYGFPFEESLPQTGLATSPDGIQWTKYDDPATVNAPYAHSDPVLPVGNTFLNHWDAHRAIEPVVMQIDNEYIMFYTGASFMVGSPGVCRGFATSADGIHWQKSVHNPILVDDIAVWGQHLYGGSVLFYDSIYHHWFSCFTTPPDNFRPQIGYSETTICPAGDVTFNFQEDVDNFHIYYPSCDTIDGSVTISGCYITNLNGLSLLTSIGGELSIHDNPNLISLSGLDNVTSIEGSIKINNNHDLTSLSGLESIDAGSIDSLFIHDNDTLSTCDVTSICNYLLTLGGYNEIHDNATGCNSQGEVELACTVTVEELFREGYLLLFPNPARQEINILLDDRRKVDEVRIYTLIGQQILQEIPINGMIDITRLQSGIYIVEVTIDNTRLRQKLLVQR